MNQDLDIKRQLLFATLDNSINSDWYWSISSIKNVATELGMPNQVNRFFLDDIDTATYDVFALLLNNLDKPEVHKKIQETKSITKNIIYVMRLYFKHVYNNKLAFNKIVLFCLLPNNNVRFSKIAWQFADNAWNKINDKSVSYDWYTKRTTLAIIYCKVFLFLIRKNDVSIDELYEYIDEIINNLVNFMKKQHKIVSNIGQLFQH